MGLDTRAYAKATPEWKEQWVELCNARGWRPVMFGLMREPVGQRNYGLGKEYVGGRAPFTLEDAPAWHQDGLDELPWPGGLVGGMISADGSAPSFRGKVYTEYVETVTGQSLYAACDENWQGEQLRDITEQLELAVDRPYAGSNHAERKALAQWFRVCVDNDLMVSGDC